MESFEGEADENDVDRMAPGWTASLILVCPLFTMEGYIQNF